MYRFIIANKFKKKQKSYASYKNTDAFAPPLRKEEVQKNAIYLRV
jgi:hypothetical protein